MGSEMCIRDSPKCHRAAEEPEDLEKAARTSFASGVMATPRVGIERGLDPREPCLLDERPTDEQAVAAGFKDAQDWITHSNGGRLMAPATVAAQLQLLPETSAEGGDEANDSMQWWRFLNGVQSSPRNVEGQEYGSYGYSANSDECFLHTKEEGGAKAI